MITKLRAAKDEYGFQNVSTFNGKILYNSDDFPMINLKFIISNMFATRL